MRHSMPSITLATLVATSLSFAGCGKGDESAARPASPSTSKAAPAGMAGEDHGEADTRPIPKGRSEILAALDASLAEGMAEIGSGKLAELHKVADRIEKLAEALESGGGRPGRLVELSKSLDEQGDAGNAAAAKEVITSIAAEIVAAKK